MSSADSHLVRRKGHKASSGEGDQPTGSKSTHYEDRAKNIEPEGKPERPPTRRELKKVTKIKWAVFLAIVVLSLASRYIWIDYPDETAFDEVHFGGFTSSYVDGKYFFDIHPPLAKLVLAFAAKQTGFNTSFNWENIGTKFEDEKYIYLRLTHATFGATLAPLAFLTAEAMGLSLPAAALAGCMVLFDNGYLTIARFVFTDCFLFCFMMASVWASYKVLSHATNMVAFKESVQWWFWCAMCGIALGCMVSVKWTGVGTLGVIGLRFVGRMLYEIFVIYDDKESNSWWRRILRASYWLKGGLLMIVLILAIYLGSWVIHFQVLTNSGPGDAWMPARFLSQLNGSNAELPQGEEPMGMWEKITYIHKTMYDANSGLTAPHGWGSVWYTWPFNIKGVLYWTKYYPDTRQILYLMGNPFVWWGTTVFLTLLALYGFYFLFLSKNTNFTEEDKTFWANASFLILGYVLNWIPYIGITRVCFIYHYMTSLFFAILIGPLMLDHFVKSERHRTVIVALLTALVAWGCWYWSPYTFGTLITTERAQAMEWITGWGG